MVSIVQLAVLIHAKRVAIKMPVKPFARWDVFVVVKVVVLWHVMEVALELRT